MISIIIAAFESFLLRYASLGYLLELRIKEHREQEFKALKLCLMLYLWEEKHGIPHPHTLEEVSRVFNRKIEEIRLLYDILDYENSMESLEKALASKDVNFALNI